jgi:integrase
LVVAALSTGARAGELLDLEWRDVDLKAGYAIAHDTKNGEDRRLYLAAKALDEFRTLQKVRSLHDPRVFGGYGYRRSWEKALEAAEIENFRFHDLRHTAASNLAMNGATLAEIAEVLGHKTLAMVQRYAHLSESHVSGVVARMNEKVFGP